MLKYALFGLLGLLFLLTIAACQKQRIKKENDSIVKYLADNHLDTHAIEMPDTMYYIITREGTGGHPTIANTVTVNYEGRLLSGDVFDSTYDGLNPQPATFPLTNLIEGWQIGIPKLRAGGKGTFVIFSKYAYGATPPSGSIIKKNEVLVFDIELISFQ